MTDPTQPFSPRSARCSRSTASNSAAAASASPTPTSRCACSRPERASRSSSIHGSGMSAPTWAPLIAQLGARRVIAVDLPGFGLSDAFDYRGRTLREHAVAQLSSLLDALELDEAELAGNSLGAMWALSLAQAAPERVTRVTVYGVPAVSLPGVKANAFFRLASTPVLGRLILRVPRPRTPARRRRT